MLKVVSKRKKTMEKRLLANKGETVRLIIFLEKVRINLQPKLMFTENEND